MIASLLRKLFGNPAKQYRAPVRTVRRRLLTLETLEDRFTPANLTWVGAAGAGWSVAANWSPAQVPVAADTVIYDGTPGVGANTNSKMDLGGVGSYHVAKLVTQNGYNQTITLNANLYVDILSINTNAEVTGAGGLYIDQRTNGLNGIPIATLFGASMWSNGIISAKEFGVYSDLTHPATVNIGFAGTTISLDTNFITDTNTTVNWKAGQVSVLKGKTVTNGGTFFADSPGNTMGNTGGAADKWIFQNNNILNMGKGKFLNETLKSGPGSRQGKIASGSMGTDVFEISGSVALADATTTLEVDSGTLLVDGSLTQSAGTTTVMFGTTLSAAGVSLSGGTFYLYQGTLLSSADVQVLSGGTFSGMGEVTLLASGGTLDNYGTMTVSMGTFHVTGNYTQTGILNEQISSLADRMVVSGLATLGGTLNITDSSGTPSVGNRFHVFAYGSRSGVFATVNLPALTTGTWSIRYDDPLYPNELTLWVV